jgi:hypothetical protein
MGINFSDLFNQAKEELGKKAEEFLSVGAPGLEVTLQQWGIDTLERMKKESQGELNTALKEITKQDAAPGSFGAALSSTIKGTFLENYGMHIVFGVIALILIGFYLRGR